MSTIRTKISVESSGDGIDGESEWDATEITNSAGAAGGPVKYAIATGVNSIAVPSGSMAMVLQPPASSPASFRLPGVSGATGMAMRSGYPCVIPLPTGLASVLVQSDREEFVYIHWG